MAPSDTRKRVISEWLTRVRGERTQEWMAADISATTGWNIDRPRLGRYENQRLDIGPKVIEHLADYAKAKGIPEPDFTPAPEPVVVDPVAAAIDRQTAVLERLAKALEGLAADQRAGQGALGDGLGLVLQEVIALRQQSAAAGG